MYNTAQTIKQKITAKVAVILLFLVGIVLMYGYVDKYLQPLNKEVIDLALNESIELSETVVKNIKQSVHKKDFFNPAVFQKETTEKIALNLQILQNLDIQNAYIVIDVNGKYYFLPYKKADKQSRFLKYFEKKNYAALASVYKSGQAKMVYPDDETMGLSYLKPINIDNRTVAVLVLKYNGNSIKAVEALQSKLNFIVVGLLLFAFLFFIGLLIQTYRALFLQEKIYRDELTNLYNRYYLKTLEASLDLSNYYILMIDIDLFKRINDSYGHDAGDFVLKEFAALLSKYMRKRDFLIRYGGEEFLAVVKKGSVDVAMYANSMRKLIENNKFIFDDRYIPVSISVGIYLNETNRNSLSLSVRQADIALYEAKKTGRNKVVIASHELKGDVNAEQVREAMENNLLFCEYHSIVDIKTNKISHYEALVRIKDKGVTIYPDSFLPAIENTFLYTQITKKIFLLNIQTLDTYKDIHVSVNFSPEDLLDDGVLELLIVHKRYAPRILIEILETQNVSYNLLNESLKKLRQIGYKICIDDFGSGYSNFVHLLRMEVDYLKLDANLIKDIADNKINYTIVESIALLCKKSNIKTIAEYVESKAILKKLKELHIDYAQGFYFANPKVLEMYDVQKDLRRKA